MKYHVHIYKVTSMVELDVEASSKDHARNIASFRAKDMEYKEPDSKYVEVIFEEK